MAGSKSVKLGPFQDVSLKLIRLRDYRKEQEKQTKKRTCLGQSGPAGSHKYLPAATKYTTPRCANEKLN